MTPCRLPCSWAMHFIFVLRTALLRKITILSQAPADTQKTFALIFHTLARCRRHHHHRKAQLLIPFSDLAATRSSRSQSAAVLARRTPQFTFKRFLSTPGDRPVIYLPTTTSPRHRPKSMSTKDRPTPVHYWFSSQLLKFFDFGLS